MDSASNSANTTSANIPHEASSDPERRIPTTPIESENGTPSPANNDETIQQDDLELQEQHESLLSTSNTRPAINTLRQLANFAMAASTAASTTASALYSTNSDSRNNSESPMPSGYPTLAQSGSVPLWAKLLVPFLCLACQLIFFYGQTEPMWKLHVNADIDVWANATEYTARRTFDILGLDYHIPIVLEEKKDVQTFTYMYAIKELWTAKDLPGLLLPRLAAVLLIIFSGIWPHLKLAMLNLTWFFGRHRTRRTKTLAWLSGLGKWSLADVLVVCVMVGVLNLDWIVDPGAIKEGVINDLPSILEIAETLVTEEQVCDKLLKLNCAHERRVARIAKCKACKGLVSEAFGHPEWARSTGRKIVNGISTSGGGKATLRVVGMSGIYYFCGAVILSIFLSLVVDIFDHRAKVYERRREEEARGIERGYRERGGLLLGERPVRRLISERGDSNYNYNNTNHQYTSVSDEDRLDAPLLGHGTDNVSLEIEVSENIEAEINRINRRSGNGKLFPPWFLMVAFPTAIIVYLAAEMYTMERIVYGAGPKLLHEVLGMDWQKPYSFQTLMWTTGAAGGMDYMLMGTFGLFCVVGPVVRAVLLFFTIVLDQCHVQISNVAVIVNFLGSFCAWEVFAIATIMVQMLMPSITDTIIRNPACASISDDGSCLKIEFNLVPIAFSMVLIGGSTLVGLSWITTGRAMISDKEYEHDSVRTSSGGNVASNAITNERGPSPLSRVMRRNHDYERLQGIEEGNSGSTGGEMEELVFETNQL